MGEKSVNLLGRIRENEKYEKKSARVPLGKKHTNGNVNIKRKKKARMKGITKVIYQIRSGSK